MKPFDEQRDESCSNKGLAQVLFVCLENSFSFRYSGEFKNFSTAKTHLIYFVTNYDIVSYSSFISKGKLLGNVFFSILRKIVCFGAANVSDFHGRPLLAPTGDIFYFILLNFYCGLQYFFQ